MALDNAQFISELSPIDPPGTDPLNQGDDHIRTIKTAVQQSFPNVGSAVPQTGVQMAQMAIKNETNTFTVDQVFSANISVSRIRSLNGTAALPSHSFTNNTNLGMYRDVADRLSFASAGVLKFLIEPTRVQAQAPVFVGGGAGLTAGSPAFAFETSQNTGMFLFAVGTLAFAAAGARPFSMSATLVASEVFHQFDLAGTRFFAFANHIRKTSTSGVGGFVYEDAAGIGRWLLGQSTAANGERFTLQRRDSGGTPIDSPWEVLNTDGHVRVLNLDMIRRIDAENTVIAFMTAGTVVRHTLNFEASGGFNPQSLTFSSFNSSGAFIANVIRIGPNSELFMEALPTVNPGGSNRLWKSSGFVAIT